MVTVTTLHGLSATSWMLHEDPELLDRSDIRQHEFDTEPEAHAFRAGVQLGIDAALFCECTPPLIVVDECEDIVVH